MANKVPCGGFTIGDNMQVVDGELSSKVIGGYTKSEIWSGHLYNNTFIDDQQLYSMFVNHVGDTAIVTFIEDNDLNYMEMRDLKHDIDDLIDDEISSAKLRMLLDFGMSALDQYDDYDDDDLDKDFDDGNDDEGSDIKHHFNGFGAQLQKFCAEAPDFSRGEQSDGYDHWSSLETSDILQDDPQKSVILKALENNLSNEKLQKSAVRWYARGLTLEDAIRKVLVDEEVTHNAIHKKEKYNEENYYNLQSEF